MVDADKQKSYNKDPISSNDQIHSKLSSKGLNNIAYVHTSQSLHQVFIYIILTCFFLYLVYDLVSRETISIVTCDIDDHYTKYALAPMEPWLCT
jgi:thiosulfate reductase cytochrome b subunit